MKLESFASMRALQALHTSTNSHLLDHFLSSSQGDEIRETLKLRRIQFDTHPALCDELDSVCDLLDCSKREFMEMAVIDALSKAKTVFFETYKKVGGRKYGEPDIQNDVTATGFEVAGVPIIVDGESA